jgi:subtilisin-like proprotein convertase family protein
MRAMARPLARPAVAAAVLATIASAVALLAPSRAPAGFRPGDRLTLSNSDSRLIPDAPDGGGVLSKIKVRAFGRIRDLDVKVRIDHTFDADINIYLVSPTGRFVELSTDNGGSGDNYGAGSNSCSGLRTTFDDEAGTSIRAGAAPFLGAYRPQTPLSRLDGRLVHGVWRLQVFDDGLGDTGILGCWQLKIRLR